MIVQIQVKRTLRATVKGVAKYLLPIAAGSVTTAIINRHEWWIPLVVCAFLATVPTVIVLLVVQTDDLKAEIARELSLDSVSVFGSRRHRGFTAYRGDAFVIGSVKPLGKRRFSLVVMN